MKENQGYKIILSSFKFPISINLVIFWLLKKWAQKLFSPLHLSSYCLFTEIKKVYFNFSNLSENLHLFRILFLAIIQHYWDQVCNVSTSFLENSCTIKLKLIGMVSDLPMNRSWNVFTAFICTAFPTPNALFPYLSSLNQTIFSCLLPLPVLHFSSMIYTPFFIRIFVFQCLMPWRCPWFSSVRTIHNSL